MSYLQVYYQLVFGTKNRRSSIDPSGKSALYNYTRGIINNKGCTLYCINGIEDHIPILSDLHPSISLADYVREIKASSSSWMKRSGRFPLFDGWQEGYGAFTYSCRERDVIIGYIKKQEEHHKQESFYDEYKRLLEEHGVKFDERFLLK